VAALLSGEDGEWITGSSRMLRIALLFLVLIIVSCYTANLAAFFISPQFNLIGPQSMRDLRNAQVCTINPNYAYGRAEFVKSIITPPGMAAFDADQGFAYCLKEMQAARVEAVMLPVSQLNQFHLKNCATTHVVESIKFTYLQWVFLLKASNLDLLTNLTQGILTFTDSGEYVEKRRVVFSMGETCGTEEKSASAIGLEHMYGFFATFGVLLAFSVAMMFTESQTMDTEVDDSMATSEKIDVMAGMMEEMRRNMKTLLHANGEHTSPVSSPAGAADGPTSPDARKDPGIQFSIETILTP